MADSVDISPMNWIRGGAFASLFALAVTVLLRRWRLAWVAASFAAGFLDKWRETHLGAGVRELLSRSGRDA